MAKYDWEYGEKHFRLGQLTASEIAKRLGCSPSTVTRHMEKRGITRDKSREVQRRTRERIATQKAKPQKAKRKVYEITDDDINEAVDSNIALIMSHRKDLSRLSAIEDKLLEELDGEPTKFYLSSYQGTVVEKVVGLTVTEKSATLLNLANVRAKRIEKQRQAFNLDDTNGAGSGKLDDMSRDELLTIARSADGE